MNKRNSFLCFAMKSNRFSYYRVVTLGGFLRDLVHIHSDANFLPKLIGEHKTILVKCDAFGEESYNFLHLIQSKNKEWQSLTFLERLIEIASRLSFNPFDSELSDSAPIPLHAIWNHLRSQYHKGYNGNQSNWYYIPKPLNLEDALFPTNQVPTSLSNNFTTLWEKLSKDLNRLFHSHGFLNGSPEAMYQSLVNTLLYVLQAYTWGIAVGSDERGKITPLFEYLRLTATYVSSLFLWINEDPKSRYPLIGGELPPVLKTEWQVEPESQNSMADATEVVAKKLPFLLVGGDISGIQSFIYDIYSTRAKKALKGRSFYLQLLVEAIIERFLQELGLCRHHILYASGGKFFLLLPHTEQVLSKLRELRKDLLKWLWKKHQNSLYIAVDWVSFGIRYQSDTKSDQFIWTFIETDDNKKIKKIKKWKQSIEVPEQIKHIHIFSNENEREKYISEWKKRITYGDLWWLLNDRLREQKTQRWKYLFDDESFFRDDPDSFSFSSLFECAEEGGPYSGGGKNRSDGKHICAVTGLYLDVSKMESLDKNDSESPLVSKDVGNQIELGTKLHDADYLVLYYSGKDSTENFSFRSDATIWGVKIWILNKGNSQILSRLPDHGWLTICQVNRIENFIAPDTFRNLNQPVSWGYFLYGGNKVIRLRDHRGIASFRELTRKEKDEELVTFLPGYLGVPDGKGSWETTVAVSDEESTTYLGVFRADVDNLGELFIWGLPIHWQSFALLSHLSWQLNWFFSGYLNTLQSQYEKFRKHLQIIYAGGDDLFVVGRWDVVLAFALLVRQKFHEFVCRRVDLGISGALPFVSNNFPIQLAARIAGEEEEKAKNFVHSATHQEKFELKQKDALTLFGIPFSWTPCHPIQVKEQFDFIYTDELNDEVINRWALQFYENYNNDTISKGFLYLFTDYYVRLEMEGYIKTISNEDNPNISKESSYIVTKDNSKDSKAFQWIWHLSYQIGRLRKDKENAIQFLDELLKFVWCGNNQAYLPPIRVLPILAVSSRLITLADKE